MKGEPPTCHESVITVADTSTRDPRQPVSPLIGGIPRPALALAIALGAVATAAFGWLAVSPFDVAAFGGLTVPIVLAAGFADGLNPKRTLETRTSEKTEMESEGPERAGHAVLIKSPAHGWDRAGWIKPRARDRWLLRPRQVTEPSALRH